MNVLQIDTIFFGGVMKKSWLKTLLIVVLAMALVFSLVACGETPNNPGRLDEEQPPIETPLLFEEMETSEYFNTLWTLASKIGEGEIAPTDDIALHFGIELAVNTRNVRKVNGVNQIMQQIDLGLDVQAVLGRTETTSKNTAIKVKIYDPTDKNHSEIVALYLFASELENIYVDFGGKNIKVPQEVASIIWNEVFENDKEESQLGDEIFKGLAAPIFGEGEDAKSINDYIDMFVGDFGEDWTLNTPINKVLQLIPNFDISGFLDKILESAGDILGLSKDQVLVNGQIQIEKVFESTVLQGFLLSEKATSNDVTTYKVSLDETIKGIVIGVLGDMGTAIFGDTVENTDMSISFTEKAGEIDSLSIAATLGGLARTNIGRVNGGSSDISVTPEVVLTITEFSIEKLTVNNGIAIDTEKYTDKVAVEEKLAFEMHGVTIGTIEELGNEPIELDGKIEVVLLGQLDIFNVENNGTKLNLIVNFATGNNEPAPIATVSFANGTLAGSLKEAIKIEDGEFAGTYKGFVFDTGINVGEFFRSKIVELGEWIKDMVSGASVSAPASSKPEVNGGDPVFGIQNWINTIKTALKLVRTNNNLQLSTNDILQTVVDVANNFGVQYGENGKNTTTFFWTREGREEAIINSLTNPPLSDDTTLMDCIAIIMENLGIEFAEGEGEATTMQAVLRALYICAQAVEIEGVDTVPADSTVYIENIKAVLAAKITILGDVQDGIHASIEANIANAMIKISESLNIIDVKDDTFTDVYAEYQLALKNEELAGQWININDFMDDEE